MSDLMEIYGMMDRGKNQEALELVLQTLAKLDQKADAYDSWLNALGYLYCNLTEYAKAIDVYERYIRRARQKDDMENLHIGFHQKAMALRQDGQYGKALDYIRKEEKIIADCFGDDPLKRSVNAYELGYIPFLMGHLEEAEVQMRKSLAYALKTDDLVAQACAYRGLGEICRKGNDPIQADAYFDQAYELLMQSGSPVWAEEVNRIRKNNLS